MPHMPLAATGPFLGKSGFGLYGDVVQEMDYQTGRLLDFLATAGIEENTLVIFTSDNGPWQPLSRPDPSTGGSAFPFRGHKANEFEGGLRVPCIVRWLKFLPKGIVSDTFWTAMDFLPTFAGLAGADLPRDRILDGHPVLDVLTGERTSPYSHFYYYHYNELNGVRSGDWKFMVPLTNRDEHYFHYQMNPTAAEAIYGPPEAPAIDASLFNLRLDTTEKKNFIHDFPRIAERMRKLLENARHDLGDKRTAASGANRRPAGQVTPEK
jgi:arylsulfatase